MRTPVRWYQVELTPGAVPGRFTVREHVQAGSPDAALRAVMRKYGVSFANYALVWVLSGRRCRASERHNVCVRLLRQQGVTR